MAPTLGFTALLLIICLNLFLPFFNYLNAKKDLALKSAQINEVAAIITGFSFFLALSAQGCLIYCYVTSDFSVLNVYQNSHHLKPLIYKISGSWGNHEGSMLLLISVISGYSFLFALLDKSEFKIAALSSQSLITLGLASFTAFASNPFERIFPALPEGLGLNPLLQDIGLALHPPMLYVGYIGFSLVFSLAISALLKEKVNEKLAHIMQFWLILSWGFLTLGIGLGSWWAYRELGWGGYWFWDPVENVSLMPWLAATALLHSVMLLKKKNIFKIWTTLLAIINFILCLLGIFLVRSGLLTSVHSFAVDAKRGFFIIMLITVIGGAGMLIFALKANKIKFPRNVDCHALRARNDEVGDRARNDEVGDRARNDEMRDMTRNDEEERVRHCEPASPLRHCEPASPLRHCEPASPLRHCEPAGRGNPPATQELASEKEFPFFSKIGMISLNNYLLVTALFTVVLGTLYPIFAQNFFDQSISVGASYYNKIFAILLAPFLIFLIATYFLHYEKMHITNKRLILATLVSTALTTLVILKNNDINLLEILLLFLTFCAAFLALISKKNVSNAAHLGFALMIAGIILSAVLGSTKEINIKKSETVKVSQTSNYAVRFDDIEYAAGKNFVSRVAVFTVLKNEKEIAKLKPALRYYPTSDQTTNEASIRHSLGGDLYLAIGNKDENENYALRIYYKPFIYLIWIGCLLMFGAAMMKVSKIYFGNRKIMSVNN